MGLVDLDKLEWLAVGPASGMIHNVGGDEGLANGSWQKGGY